MEKSPGTTDRNQFTLDSMLEGCQIIGFDWKYLYINDAAAAHGRRAREEYLGRTIMELYPGVESTEMYAALGRCMTERTVQHMENEFTYPDGSAAWFELSIQPVPEGIFVLSYDITELKRAGKEVSALNSRLEHLIDSVKELASARDLESIQAILRSSARKLTGADGAAIVFRDGDLCFYADEDAVGPLWKGQRFPMSACISGWVMLHKEPAVIEDIYADARVPADAYRPTFVKSLAMVPINSHDPIGAIGNYWARRYRPTDLDVRLLQTLADAASRALENVRLYESLEQRVKDRTLQLEAANRELEGFSYSVSHDLRAPLRHLTGFVELLNKRATSLDEKSRHYLHVISDAATRMGRLIDDLLAFSRMGRKELMKTPVDLRSILDDAIRDLQPETGGRSIRWDIGQLPKVTGDPAMLKLVFVNLCSNAIKFTKHRDRAVIAVGSEQQGGEFVVHVKDNGAGFDMRYVDKLFNLFQRLHATEEFEGTGVGLAGVRRIVQRHGGRTWAEGAVDKGAVVYISFPVGWEG